MKEPHFIIGGATQSGVGALINILRVHPQIFMPKARESRFFEPGKPPTRALRSCREYFEDAATTRFNNEIPADRILHGEEEHSPERAFAGAPTAKIIFTLRNPVIRAHMQFHNAKARGKETARSFEQAIEEELAGKRKPETSSICWIFKNQYHKHLNEWLNFYPRQKLLILVCEEWSASLHRGLDPLEQFLGLKKNTLSIDNAFGEKKQDYKIFYEKLLPKILDYPPIPEKLQNQLEDLFIVDSSFVENFLGRKILSWS